MRSTPGGNPFLDARIPRGRWSLVAASAADTELGARACRAAGDAGALVGAVPRYAKAHSWGEFIFDWSWRSRMRAQASPTTRSSCRPSRSHPSPDLDARPARRRRREHASGPGRTAARYCLSAPECRRARELHDLREDRPRSKRKDSGARTTAAFCGITVAAYRDFDDFLDGFAPTSARRRGASGGASPIGRRVPQPRGPQVPGALWRTIFAFTERTFLRHGNAHYLSAEFSRWSRSACRARSREAGRA